MLNVYEFSGKYPLFLLSHFKQVKDFLKNFRLMGLQKDSPGSNK